MITSILCPVDRSAISRRALDYALALSRTYDAKLRVFEVVDTALPPLPHGSWPAVEVTADMRRAFLGELTRFTQRHRLPGIDPEIRIAEGQVVPQILAEAGAMRADLVVMGTHGRSGFERFALGSVTEKVLRKCGRPVLAVPPGSRAPGRRGSFRTVVCAIDFSAPSRQALKYARSLVPPGGRLSLVHAVAWPFGAGSAGPMPLEIERLRATVCEAARKRLGTVARHIPDGVTVEAVVGLGKAAPEILRCARDASADVIVMGLYGHTATRLALLGSTTHRVIRDAPCPVLAVTKVPVPQPQPRRGGVRADR